MSNNNTKIPQSISKKNESEKIHRFVIAGGSYAAISAIKVLGNDILPRMIADKSSNFKIAITVIAPNREAYWNVAAVRIISEVDLLETNTKQLFYPLVDTFKQYFPPEYLHGLNIIQGKVISVDPETNTVSYIRLDDNGPANDDFNFLGQELFYDSLILATGASSSSAAFKLNGTSEESKSALRELHNSAHAAQSIAIIGGGGVGVELAGELGYKYGKTKKITLFTELGRALQYLKPKISEKAIKRLEELGVETVVNHRAVSIVRDDDSYEIQSPNTEEEHPHEYNNDITASKTHKSTSNELKPLTSTSTNGRLHKLIHLHHGNTHGDNGTFNESSSDNSSQGSLDTESSTLDNSTHNYNHDLSKFPTYHKKPSRTTITFQDGSKATYDCCIPATGNTPNTQYLPDGTLDSEGYVLADSYLRMLNDNPNKNIYVIGDLLSGGRETMADISNSQILSLKATLIHDVVDSSYPLKKYVISPPSYLVPISKKGGVGTMNGFTVPSVVVTMMKGRDFRMEESHKYLE
ncbi:uncharacterized protein SAPINGB_P003872 [Magnusiomyces paraingens]|uniref:FAD/NAD(P)-binding domain-containing protein n=1 Tax=Magnusiomyces paraingens TaxID=2606893 RepID=A0A5E8BSN0_9ASCO|nr:uncharacterized protein SAPINGB_P003872 [Saprochaete ingens]VVT54031.1 unnamed protein product [Saprochaete ingens]